MERRRNTPVVKMQAGVSYNAVIQNAMDFSAMDYEQLALRITVQSAMAELNDEQLGNIYDKLKTDKTNKMFVKKNFINAIRSGDGTTAYARLFSRTPDEVLDVFGEALGPERMAKLEARPPRRRQPKTSSSRNTTRKSAART